MDYSNFMILQQEAGLMLVFLILLVYDIFGTEASMRWFRLIACGLFGIHTIGGFFSGAAGVAFGGMFISSTMTVFMKNLLNVATLLVLMQAGEWLRTPKLRIREGEFYIITLATLLGMYLMISAGNFMLLYIGIEIASLPVAFLAAYNKYEEHPAEAGAKYILMTALSSGIMMFGLSYLYGAMGTMYFDDLGQQLMIDPMTILGFVFFFAGLAFKISIVPFHLWTADVYEGAPTPVTAYLSVVSKGAACFVLLFTLYHVFGAMEQVWYPMLWGLSVITIMIGNLFALRQKDMKRFFTFSSISQAGYILLGVMPGTAQGMTATVYFILIYLFSNLAVFGVITALENRTQRTDIAAYNGLYKTNPVWAFVMMIAVFSLAGIPPFAGFFSKFFIFASIAERGEYLLVFIALINTVVSLYYYLLIIKAMFIREPDESLREAWSTDQYNKTSLLICGIGILVIGFLSGIYEHIGSLSAGLFT
ncbi:MAG: NADH-quinone oxidoreductase subunit N [Tannerellaceae bacterium]|nr:NADH-quinone oxidoreductase subunit N [Tannerellaceae bacterium]